MNKLEVTPPVSGYVVLVGVLCCLLGLMLILFLVLKLNHDSKMVMASQPVPMPITPAASKPLGVWNYGG